MMAMVSFALLVNPGDIWIGNRWNTPLSASLSAVLEALHLEWQQLQYVYKQHLIIFILVFLKGPLLKMNL